MLFFNANQFMLFANYAAYTNKWFVNPWRSMQICALISKGYSLNEFDK